MRLFFDLFDLERWDIRHPNHVASFQIVELLVLIKLSDEIRIRMKAFTQKLAV